MTVCQCSLLSKLCLQECVVHSTDDYVVVHKPAGVQVAPTVDNLLENVLACTAQVLKSLFPALHEIP